jgi:transcriptional regulator with XRE-family HTH domain
MAKKFKKLFDKMRPEAQARVNARVQKALLEMNLQELRQSLTALTQQDMAKLLDVTQAYVSKAERRGGDMKISTLMQIVRAMGGTVDLQVKIPGKAPVRLNQFDELAQLAVIRQASSKRETPRQTRTRRASAA